jgi:hypothetical protein
LQRITSFPDPAGLGAHLARFRRGARQRAVGVRDRALGVAQRIARFALRELAATDFFRQLLDAPAQRLEVFFLG